MFLCIFFELFEVPAVWLKSGDGGKLSSGIVQQLPDGIAVIRAEVGEILCGAGGEQTEDFIFAAFAAAECADIAGQLKGNGMLKDPEIYNIFDTEKLLKRKPTVSINNASGLAGIAYWLNAFYELEGDNKIDKSDPLVTAVKTAVDAEYSGGRTTVMGDDELDNIVRFADRRRHKLLVVGEDIK